MLQRRKLVLNALPTHQEEYIDEKCWGLLPHCTESESNTNSSSHTDAAPEETQVHAAVVSHGGNRPSGVVRRFSLTFKLHN